MKYEHQVFAIELLAVAGIEQMTWSLHGYHANRYNQELDSHIIWLIGGLCRLLLAEMAHDREVHDWIPATSQTFRWTY